MKTEIAPIQRNTVWTDNVRPIGRKRRRTLLAFWRAVGAECALMNPFQGRPERKKRETGTPKPTGEKLAHALRKRGEQEKHLAYFSSNIDRYTEILNRGGHPADIELFVESDELFVEPPFLEALFEGKKARLRAVIPHHERGVEYHSKKLGKFSGQVDRLERKQAWEQF